MNRWDARIAALAGNLASSLWFAPRLSKWMHACRGVDFEDRRSVFIGRGVVIDNRRPDLVHIGKDVWLTTGTIVLTHSYASSTQRSRFGLAETVGDVWIGEGAFIGAGSIICPGVRIGVAAYVAAGSVVTRDVPAGVLAAGNPARVIRALSGP
jgi:maltose O-acetyltransferase